MTTLLAPMDSVRTIADLIERLGGIDPGRILLHPAPGQATEADVLEVERREDRLCELVDGVLVEKVMGFRESLISVALAALLRAFVIPRNLGVVSGAEGMMRLFQGLVRIPDVAFVSWGRLPGGQVPDVPIPALVPDLAIEVLSASNTKAEMARKLREYFGAGVRLVWLVDLDARTIAVYDAPTSFTVWGVTETLDGGVVLPGFLLPVRDLFAELDRKENG